MNMATLIKQLCKFGIVGIIAFLIDYGIFTILTLLGINYLIAQVISFSISLFFNYLASVKWVFNAKEKSTNMKLLFILLSIIGLELNEIFLYIGVDLVHIHELLVKLVATGIVMIFNFITRKLIIEKYKGRINFKQVVEILLITLAIAIIFVIYFIDL